jgi:general secretion pathway protein K
MLLSLFALSVASRAAFALDLTEQLSDRLRAAYVARAAAAYAALALEHDETTADGFRESWSDNAGLFFEHPVGDGSFSIQTETPAGGAEVRYGMVDEDRGVNLNTAPRDVLRRLAQIAAGLNDEDADRLAAAIEDWRDDDDTTVRDGAEGNYYRGLEDGYDCKNGPFETVEELALVRGVTPEVYARLIPHVTAYGSGRLNVNTAGRPALLALGISTQGADGIVYYRAGEDNVEGTGDDRQAVSVESLSTELSSYVPVEDLGRLAALAAEGFLGVKSDAFRAEIRASAGSSRNSVRVACILSRDGAIRRWHER